MTPEGKLNDPAEGQQNRKCESADRVKLRKEEERGIDGDVSNAEEWEESGVEEKPAV